MRSTRLSVLRISIPLLLLCATAGGRAHGQEDLRVGSVRVHLQADAETGADFGFAAVETEAGTDTGFVVWACGGEPGGLSVGVLLTDDARRRPARRAIWRFDQDAPLTTELQPDPSYSLSLLSGQEAGAVTARARTAQRLVVQVPTDTSGTRTAEYRYSLAGLDSALSRLRCGPSPRPDGPRAGARTLRNLEWISLNGPDSPPELAVIEPPELSNEADLRRRVARSYPPLLKDAGMGGTAVIRARVLASGSVDTTSIQVAHASHPAFGEAGARVMPHATFRPARLNGRPVAAWTALPINYSPGVAAPGAPPAPSPER